MEIQHALALMADAAAQGYQILVLDEDGPQPRLLDLEASSIMIADTDAARDERVVLPLLSLGDTRRILPLEVVGRTIATESRKKSRAILRSLQFIEERLADPRLSLDGAAGAACLSKSYFCRLFKKQMKVTFSRYVLELRIGRAKRLLRASPRSVTDISLDSGFSNLTYFERMFKRFVGVNPTAFRMGSGPGRPHEVKRSPE